MLIPPKYSSMTLWKHNPTTGVAETITEDDIKINDSNVPAFELQFDSNTAAVEYSESRTLSLEIPGLKAAAGNKRAYARVRHQDNPSNVRLRMARFTGAWVVDEELPTPADAMGTFPVTDVQNSALADYRNGFYLDHDTVNSTLAYLRLQYDKAAQVLPSYDWKLDRGNTGITTIAIDVPYADAEISNRANERADEAVGVGPTRVYVKPAYRRGTATVNENYVWSRFYEIGCLQSEAELEFVREYTETMKGFNLNRVAKSIKDNKLNINVNATADTHFLSALIDNLLVSKYNHLSMGTSQKGELPLFEVVLETRTPAGLLIFYRLPSAYIIRNGNVTEGGTEKTIPIQIQSNEPPVRFTSDLLYCDPIEFAFGFVLP